MPPDEILPASDQSHLIVAVSVRNTGTLTEGERERLRTAISAYLKDNNIGRREMVRRSAQRIRWLRRMAELRQTPKRKGKSDDDLFRRVVYEAKRHDPLARVSSRSLRRWAAMFNTVTPDGLSAGFRAVTDRYTCGRQSIPNPVRKRRRRR